MGANLIEADLKRADLTGASLEGADLKGADFIGAKLIKVDLRLANLAGAKVTQKQAELLKSKGFSGFIIKPNSYQVSRAGGPRPYKNP